MSVNTYDPQDVNVIVNGTILTGFADGTFVQVERNEESYTTQVGSKGEVARSKNANKTGKITVTLMQDSPSNTVLNKLSNSKDPFSISVVDQNFDTNAGGPECWVEKPASVEYGKELGQRQWVFVVAELDITEG